MEASQPLNEDEQIRAGTYSLLAALLRSAPDQALLQRLQAIEAGPAETATDSIAGAWAALKQAADRVDGEARDEGLDKSLERLNDEYHELFIGLGRGELVPYGSWYLTGFLMEKPLSDLRQDLATLGIERQDGVREPEDHIAALCEVMALLISDPDVPFGVQRKFFETHLGPWVETFFLDLEQARAARFYRAVAHLGKNYINLEKRYLAMLV